MTTAHTPDQHATHWTRTGTGAYYANTEQGQYRVVKYPDGGWVAVRTGDAGPNTILRVEHRLLREAKAYVEQDRWHRLSAADVYDVAVQEYWERTTLAAGNLMVEMPRRIENPAQAWEPAVREYMERAVQPGAGLVNRMVAMPAVEPTDDEADDEMGDDTVVIEVSVGASPTSDSMEVPRAEWNAMTPAERLTMCEDFADTTMGNAGGFGWNVVGAPLDDVKVTPNPLASLLREIADAIDAGLPTPVAITPGQAIPTTLQMPRGDIDAVNAWTVRLKHPQPIGHGAYGAEGFLAGHRVEVWTVVPEPEPMPDPDDFEPARARLSTSPLFNLGPLTAEELELLGAECA